MSKEYCSKCKFYEKNNIYELYGRCRRFPPTNNSLGNSIFPEVKNNMWCGEFKHKDKFIDIVANYKPDENVIPPEFTTTTESFDPKK